jgi:rhodanese-related sulfurtransferase
MPSHEILSITSSRPNPETLDVHEVLPHPHAVFYYCTCGLRGGAAMVVAVLIDYDNVKIASGTTTRRRRS